MTRGWVAWGLCSFSMLLPGVVAAQGTVVVDDGVARCVALDTSRRCTAVGGTACAVAGDECQDFGLGGFCAPPDALFCTLSPSNPCPVLTHAFTWNGLTICVDVDASLCGDATELACFTTTSSPGGPTRFPVAWRAGDCDGDGVPNGAEAEGGLCVPRPTIGVTTGDDCATPVGCTDAETCLDDSECVLIERAAHSYCLPVGGFIFCCGGIRGIGCPNGNLCQSSPSTSDDFGFCEPFEYCTDFFYDQRLDCLEGEAGFPVEPDDGDCDGDGLRNVEDADPCVPAPDAGVVGQDAGSQRDAGPARDAGETTPMDAGALGDAGPATIQPGFTGGGGCRCRAAPTSRGSGVLFGLGIAALMIAQRRRR